MTKTLLRRVTKVAFVKVAPRLRVRAVMLLALLLLVVLPSASALAKDEDRIIHAGGLSGDVLYAVGGDQQKDIISVQHIVLSKAGIEFDYTEYDTMQEGFEALQKGEIDTLYPMTPYKRDLEPYGFVASDPVYTISWDIMFTGEYSQDKLNRIAVPAGRLAPFYCAEVFPKSELLKCGSRLDCLDAVIEGKADSAVFNGFQTENIIQNGSKYSKLCYTVLPTETGMTFALRKDDKELLNIINDCIAKTTEFEKTDYMVKSRVVAIEQSARDAMIARYTPVFVVIAFFLILLICLFFVITRQVIVPLREFNRCLEMNDRLPEKGWSYVRELAATYNKLYDSNIETQELLHHEAGHDALTGLLNRRSFENCLDLLTQRKEPYALMIIDLDRFKHVNDTYGHAVGDKILKKVADAIHESFRSYDHVCRIGGDEFCVLVVHPPYDLATVLGNKTNHVNEVLANTDDGLPAIAVSAGAALSVVGRNSDDVYRRADQVLYEVKSYGHGGFKLYEGK